MTRVGFDARSHGQSAGTTLNDSNVAAIAHASCVLSTAVNTGGSLTFEATDLIQAADTTTAAYAYINTVTSLSGDACSGMIMVPSCPTPGATSRVIQVRNANDTADVVRLALNTSRQWELRNGADTVICGPLVAVTAGAPVRIGFSFDISAGTANLWQYTTNPTTSTTADASDADTSVNFNAQTGIGKVRVLAPHSSGVITISSTYAVLDDSTVAALAPLSNNPPVSGGVVAVVPAVTITGVTGGDGVYSVSSVTQTGGTSIGNLSYAGLTVWGEMAAVDEVTLSVVVRDATGEAGDPITAIIPAPSAYMASSGTYLWDTAKPGGAGYVTL